jgi:hypothetical protein
MIDSTLLKVVALLLLVLSFGARAQEFAATRLNNAMPILSKQHFDLAGASVEEGANINGPSVIRVPDWIPLERRASPRARYYMYFGHHKGRYIRLAWAESLEGPWRLYNTGRDIPEGKRGVLDIGDDRKLKIGQSLKIVKHVASPDVHVDHDNKRIEMYFHGPIKYKNKLCRWQKTLSANSLWGLDFSSGIKAVVLSSSYLRVFEAAGVLQGLSSSRHYTSRTTAESLVESAESEYCGNQWQGRPARFMDFSGFTQSGVGPFTPARTKIRHLGIYKADNRLHVFFTMKGHAPERILATSVMLNSGCWQCTAPQAAPVEILRAKETWEGGAVAPSPSTKGAQFELENALRDPFLFYEDDALYLFYVGGGERAIGLAQLTRTIARGREEEEEEDIFPQ